MDILQHLDKLTTFNTVAEKGSISTAAKILSLSQPAVTRAIQTLEEAVGLSLFNRDRSGMHLTDAGKVLHSSAIRILREATDAVSKASHVQEEMLGNLHIGTYESLAAYLWPDFLLKTQSEYPLLNISLRTQTQKEHLNDLRNGAIDLLVDAEPRGYDGLTLWPLYKDSFSFYASSKVELNQDTAKKLSLLLVRGAFDESNTTLEQHLSQKSYQFQREYAFDSFTTVKSMAVKGLGIAILPRRLVNPKDKLKLITAKHFKASFADHQIYATVSPHRENDRRVKSLIRILKRQLSK